MIAVDTSALMAIVLDEPEKSACMAVIRAERDLVISAATVAEALIVAGHRGLGTEMQELIDGLGFETRAVALTEAHQAAAAHMRWGKGVHPAGLNFADCFAYALAKQLNCPLLFFGNDFAKTDVRSALAERAQPGGL